MDVSRRKIQKGRIRKKTDFRKRFCQYINEKDNASKENQQRGAHRIRSTVGKSTKMN